MPIPHIDTTSQVIFVVAIIGLGVLALAVLAACFAALKVSLFACAVMIKRRLKSHEPISYILLSMIVFFDALALFLFITTALDIRLVNGLASLWHLALGAGSLIIAVVPALFYLKRCKAVASE